MRAIALVSAGIIFGSFCNSFSAHAASPGSASASGDELEEVVVTAERREQNLQKVPISIQVKQGEDLRKEGKQRVDEIMQGTVGIQAQDNHTGLTFFIRGVDSSAGNPGTLIPSPVAIMIDGVNESRSEAVRGDTLDMSRAEIMRGPQSTTIGANSLSGAISLVSNQPELGEYHASGSIEKGNYEKQALQGMLNVPLTDTTALRFAYSSAKRNGYISNGSGNSDLGQARAKFRWQPKDNLDTVFTINHQLIGGNGASLNQLLAFGYWRPIDSANATFNNGTLGLSSNGCQITNGNYTIWGCPAKFYAYTPSTPDGTQPNFRQRSNPWNDGYPSGQLPEGPYAHTIADTISAQINWTTDLGTFSVLPAFEFAKFQNLETPMGTAFFGGSQREATTSVDAHFNSKAGGRLTYTVGAYYKNDHQYDMRSMSAFYPGIAAPGSFPNPCNVGGYVSPTNCYQWSLQPYQDQINESLYFNSEWSLTNALRLIGGARYNHDEASQATNATVWGDANGANPAITQEYVALGATPPASGTATGRATWQHGTFRAGFEWDAAPRTMFYATYSTGYTPGRLSVAAPGPLPPGALPVSIGTANTLSQIALGWKSQFLDNRLQFNGEVFDTTYFNRPLQGTLNAYYGTANANNCVASGIAGPPPPLSVGSAPNGGYCANFGGDAAIDPELNSKGIDIDGSWLLSSNDRVNFTFEYLKSEYKALPQFSPAIDYSPASLIAQATAQGLTLSPAVAQLLSAQVDETRNGFVGATPQNSPTTSATLDYQHAFQLQGGSHLTPRIAAVYKSKYWSWGGSGGANIATIIHDSSSSDLAWQQSYATWDLFLNWQSADGKFDINGYMKNVSNEVIMANYTYPYVTLQPPRTFGIIVSARM